MPLYEYQCDDCGNRFEVIQKFSDPPVAACTSCGGSVKKLLSSPAIQFKGSGWYITDYARKGGQNGGAAGASSESSSSEPAKSDSAKTGADTTASSSTPGSNASSGGTGSTGSS